MVVSLHRPLSLYQDFPRLYHRLEVLRGLILAHYVKSPLFLQPLVDESPGAIFFRVDLTFTVVSAPTRTI